MTAGKDLTSAAAVSAVAMDSGRGGTYTVSGVDTEISMRPTLLPALAVALSLASGCTESDDPQLAMCQAMAKQLTGDRVAAWDETSQSDGRKSREVSIAYSLIDDSRGSIDCVYRIDGTGTVETAPTRVALNGEPVGTGELLGAGTRASVELLAGTAAETVARTRGLAREARELAGEAGEVASDLAVRERDAAVEGGKVLRESLER